MVNESAVIVIGKKSLFFFLFLLSLLVVGYYFLFHQNAPDYRLSFFENSSVKSVEYDENKVPESFGFGIYHSYDPRVGMNQTQYLKKNESLTGYLRITNAIHNENQYLIFALVDYKAVPFYIDGNRNLTHSVNLSSMEDIFLSFKIENFSIGYHDLFLGVFLNPFEHSLDKGYRMRTDFALMGSRRLNVIVGGGSTPQIPFKQFKEFCDPSYPLDGLLVNKDPCSPKAWTVENSSINDGLNYFINVGNKKRDQRTFALVQFLDYNQIPILSNTSEYVYFGYLDKNQKASVPASLITPNRTGVHELVVVWILDPYENLEISQGIRNRNLEAKAEPSIRIGLNISGDH